MKFFSKNSNLGIVLKPGLPGNAQLGTTTTPGIYARFKDGVIDIGDENLVKLMLAHPGFGSDFIMVEEASSDPYAGTRPLSEPTHRISEIDHGQPKRVTKDPLNITPEIRNALMDMAKEMAKPMAIALTKEMLPGAVQEVIKAMSQDSAAKSEDAVVSTPKKGGRPKKVVETI